MRRLTDSEINRIRALALDPVYYTGREIARRLNLPMRNVQRYVTGFRGSYDHRNRWLRGELSPNAKLRAGEVLYIYMDGERTTVLAEQFHVSPTTISLIRRGKRWRWLTVGDED